MNYLSAKFGQVYWIVSFLYLFSACSTKKDICYLLYNFKDELIDSCSIRIEITDLHDNTSYLSWDGKKMYYKPRKDGIFGTGSTKFVDSQNFKVHKREYVVYKYLQEEMGQEPCVSYFASELGFFLKYYLHSGSKLILCSNVVVQLIEKMKENENFTYGMFKKNPKKDLNDYLPEK